MNQPYRQADSKPEQPKEKNVGKIQMTILIQTNNGFESHIKNFVGYKMSYDSLGQELYMFITAESQFETWLTAGQKIGFYKLTNNLYVPTRRIEEISVNKEDYFVTE